MTQINVRIEERVKREAGKTLADIGLDMSSAITIFLKQEIEEVVLMLAKGESLPSNYEDHQLTGEWKQYREFSYQGRPPACVRATR